ncbi:peptide/nickel transport system substrate-binding protein [Kitasatospora sp. MAP12-15]|uniref:ABC transporter family substrate-binding protein n=1 Tax=unclassified Kitasatospora TaxID=2633591 RepID=UPI00247311A2|nr:ABC transporter family substrate-binding protein [Kitasatospora sp. MAP12-44]MDH6110637.1 peptide/nickel transport system substrate-binding protein [Kitasatospora sp. MAP12-44]
MAVTAPRRRRLARSTTAATATALVLLVAGCSSSGSGAGAGATKSAQPGLQSSDINPQPLAQVKDGGELRLPLEQWIDQWNPIQVDGTYGDSVEIMKMIEPELFRVDTTGTFQPVADFLVSAKVVSTSPQVVLYTLNPKAKWSDGKALSYLDFKAEWQAANGTNPAFNVSSTTGYDQISDVSQGADPTQVKVTFSKPFADWQNLFYPLLPAAGISTPDQFNKGWIENVPITGGAFKIGSQDKAAQTITVVPDPNWWGTKPKLDKFTYRVLSSSAITQAFLNNEIDVASAGQADTYSQLKADADAVIRSASPWDEVHISLGSNGPLADLHVRQAIDKAVDRDALIKVMNQGVPVAFPKLGNHILMTNQAGYQDNSGTWGTYDLAAAQKLLTDAGWQDAGAGKPRTKDGQTLELHFVVSQGSSQATADMAAATANMLLQAGIKLDVDRVPDNDFFEKYVNVGKFDLASWRNTGSFPPSAIIPSYQEPVGDNVFSNYSKLSTPEIDSLLKQAAATLDPVAAAKLYNQADADIWALGHTIELYQRPSVGAYRKGLANYGASGLADFDYTAVGWQK